MIRQLLKGFLIGIGKIIPGVSGAMIAISLGVYEKALNAIVNFFKKPIENFKFLFPLMVGAVLAISTCSKIIIYFLSNFYLLTMLLFIGLIVGGIPLLFKKTNILNKLNFLIFILSFSLIFLLSFISKNNNFISNVNIFTYFLIGIIDAITMIIPGISGTAVMMILGVYDIMLELLSSISNLNLYNITNLTFFIIGIILTVLLLSKFINYLFIKKEELMYASILGFVNSSIIILLINTFKNNYSIKELVLSIPLFLIGTFISKKLDN